MCISKIDPKTLDKIVREAIAIEQGTNMATVKSYEAKRYKHKSYDADGT